MKDRSHHQHEEEVLGVLALADATELRMVLVIRRGRHVLDVRQYVDSAGFAGYTRHGLSFPAGEVETLLRLLCPLVAYLELPLDEELTSFSRGSTRQIVVRLLRPEEAAPIALDIRERVASGSFAGWTKRGFRLPLDRVGELLPPLQAAYVRLADMALPGLLGRGEEALSQATALPAFPGCALLPSVIGEAPAPFPASFLGDDTEECERVTLPRGQVSIAGADRRDLVGEDSEFRHRTRSPIEARYLLYAKMRGLTTVPVPRRAFAVFRATKRYESSVVSFRQIVLAELRRRVRHDVTAERLAGGLFRGLGLPWLGPEPR